MLLIPSDHWANRPTTIESLIQYLSAVSTDDFDAGVKAYQDGNRPEAADRFYTAYQDGLKKDDIKLWSGALCLHATMLVYQRKTEESVNYYKQILNVPYEDSDLFIRAITNSSMSTIHSMRGESKKAIKHERAFLYWARYEQDDPFEEGSALRTLGYQYLALEHLDSAYTCFTEARKIHEEYNHPEGMLRSYFALGIYNQKIDSYEEAIEYYFSWLEQADRISDKKSEPQKVMIYVHLANSFMAIDQWDQAQQFSKKAIDLAEQLNLVFYRATAVLTAAKVAYHLGDYEQAKILYDDCLKNYAEQGKKPKEVEALMGLTRLHMSQQDLRTGSETIRRAIELTDSVDLLVYQWQTRELYGELLIKQKKWREAERVLNEAYRLSVEHEDLAGEEIAGRRLAEVYGQLNQPERALYYLQRSSQLKDSLYEKNNADNARLVEARFRFNEQQAELEKLDAANQLLEVKSTANRRWLILLISALAVFGIFIGALWKLYDKSRAQESVIKDTLADREILLKEIHHRVKNNLQVISSLLSMHSRQISDPGAQQAMLEGRNRVKSMALIHQNLYGDHDLVNVNTSEYIDKLIYSIVYSYKMDLDKIDIDIDVDEVRMDVDTMIPLGLIINELVSNAMKYAYESGQGALKVLLKDKDNHYELTVKDSGPGFKSTRVEEVSSLGFKIINAFVKKLKATLTIENRDGAQVLLQIPK